ncbi:capsid assembly scaffolding protein Gp46 family protein [Lactobacillus kitasatonis]|uniref:capsid assembly scaffolding protein Gp46 family protein n=1 Tax=Lactobacillus kitasatonis TaxID=237446 RepID=UPI003F667F82
MNTNDNNTMQTEAVATTETDAKADTAKASDTHDKSDNTDEKTLASKVAKIRGKMQARIDAEVAQKHDYKDKLADATKQIETLTQKLQAQNDSDRDKSKNDGNEQLDAANKEIEQLKAQITRRDQVARVDSQFKEAGVNVPSDVLDLLVPANADEKTVTANMNAFSKFYDGVVASVRKSFMTGETPKATGSSTKPFNMKDVSKIKDPIARLNIIKQHLHDN